MGLRDSVRRLKEKVYKGQTVSIAQPGEAGPPLVFPKHQLVEAYMNSIARTKGQTIEIHSLCRAAMASPDPRWHNSYYAVASDLNPDEIEDLSV